MDPLSPSTTSYHWPTRRHQSRLSTGSRSPGNSRENSPQTTVTPYHENPIASPLLGDEPGSTATPEDFLTSTVLHEKRVTEETDDFDLPGGFDSTDNDRTFKKRKLNRGSLQSILEPPSSDRHPTQGHESDAGPSRAHHNPIPSRTFSERDLMDVDAALSAAPSTQLLSEDETAFAPPTSPIVLSSPSPPLSPIHAVPAARTRGLDSLSSFNCPICFSPPTNATLTPCGHICCGECLFSAVQSSIERSAFHGPAAQSAK